MQTDRRAILTLVALGRITPSEAERLLLAWNASRETLWGPATFLAIACLFQSSQPALSTGATQVIHRGLPLLTHLFGGIL
jgi:hypothetical protein